MGRLPGNITQITSMLRLLPYDWRSAPRPRAAALSDRPPAAAHHAPCTPPPPVRAGAPSYAPASTSAPGRLDRDSSGWGTSVLNLLKTQGLKQGGK